METNPLYPSKNTENPSGKGRGNIPKPPMNQIYDQKTLDNRSRQLNPLDEVYKKSRGLT